MKILFKLKIILFYLKKIVPIEIVKIVYRKLAQRYINKLKIKYDPNRKTILVLNHFYDQDIKALARANNEYNFLVVDTPVLFKGAKIFFSEEVIALEKPYDKENPKALLQYRNECKLIFKALKKKFDLHLIITASDNYYWVREFICIAKNQNVKTVVIDKEGLISPESFDSESERIAKFAPFMSDHLYVWSERQRRYWQKTGVKNELITVLGQPRSDLFYQDFDNKLNDILLHDGKIITFFTYENDAYIPLELVSSKAVSWKQMKAETQEYLHQMSTEFENYNFIFKAHPQQSDLANLQGKYNRKNLKVIGGAELSGELIAKSDLIIAFQTTAVLEAMFMSKKIIYTGWDKTEEVLKNEVLPFRAANGLVVARSYEEFKIICKQYFLGEIDRFSFSSEEINLRNNFVNNYFYRPDGKTCKRFYDHVSKII